MELVTIITGAVIYLSAVALLFTPFFALAWCEKAPVTMVPEEDMDMLEVRLEYAAYSYAGYRQGYKKRWRNSSYTSE